MPPGPRHAPPTKDGRRPFGNARRAKRLDPVELAGIDQRTHVAAVDAQPDTAGSRKDADLFDQFVMDAAMDDQPRSGRADLPRVVEDAACGTRGSTVEVGIGIDDGTGFATQFHHAGYDILGSGAQHRFAGLDRSGKNDVVDAFVRG